MDTNIYYLSIQTVSLVDYFAQALILPARFYKNRPSDIQSRKDDYIVLSKNKFLNEANCSINLILTDEEVSNFLQKEESIFLYEKPIPISRIQKIYFKNKEQKTTTIFNIEKTKTAFIPESLIEIIEEDNKNIKNVDNSYKYNLGLEENIKTYNQILGGIAFVRNTYKGLFSENFFSILSHFNAYITKEFIDKEKIFRGYDGAFTHKGKDWDKLSPLLYKNISDNDVERYAKEEKLSIVKSPLGVYKYGQLKNINSLTYKLAILNTYGESSKRKTTNDLISDCKNEKIPNEKQEGIALIFGINNGYSSFRNQYDKKIVKFKMDSLLDYYTIESVFQYVINEQKNNQKFEYIDKLFPDEECILDISLNSTKEKKTEDSFDIEKYLENLLDYFKDNIFKLSPKELFSNILNKFKNTFFEEMNKKDIKINILNENLENKESELEDSKLKIEELNQKVALKENELQKHQNIVNQQLEEKSKELQNIQNSIKQLEQQNKVLTQSIEEKNNNINSIQDDYKNIQSELEEEKIKTDRLTEENSTKNEEISSLNGQLEEKNNNISSLENDKTKLNENIDNKVHQINNLNKSIEDKDSKLIKFEQSLKDNKATFDEEKERIIIEQTLESYVEYDRKKAPELRKIAKEKGIKYTNKPDTIKLILAHKDNRLL
jgi:predicted  nucleic acid-binding Zn-ribbon protein